MKTYIQVPYQQKDYARHLGAKFDFEKKQWYCPDGVDLAKFAKWLPKSLTAVYKKLDSPLKEKKEKDNPKLVSGQTGENQPLKTQKPGRNKKKGKHYLVSCKTIGFTKGRDCPIDHRTGEILYSHEVDLSIAPWEQNPLSHIKTPSITTSKDLGLAGIPW